MNPMFGQLVIGPAGSGKTTYCQVMSDFLRRLGRSVITINLDPANDVLPYKPTIDISKLVSLTEVMSAMNLGPNGSLLYCIEFLDTNFDWLQNQLEAAIESLAKDNKQSTAYVLVDSPGQIELYTNHNSLKSVINKLNCLAKQRERSEEKGTAIDLRLVAVNLVDSHYCSDPSKFISVVINCLNSMIHLEMPQINVLSKVDLIQKYGNTDFGIDFYCDILDLNYLVDKISDDPFLNKYKRLTQALAGVIEDYSLVSFIPLDINDNKTVIRVMKSCDKANGFYMNDSNGDPIVENFFRSPESADFEHSKYEELLEK